MAVLPVGVVHVGEDVGHGPREHGAVDDGGGVCDGADAEVAVGRNGGGGEVGEGFRSGGGVGRVVVGWRGGCADEGPGREVCLSRCEGRGALVRFGGVEAAARAVQGAGCGGAGAVVGVVVVVVFLDRGARQGSRVFHRLLDLVEYGRAPVADCGEDAGFFGRHWGGGR